ncbi:MAG: hypothetical protein IJR59_01610, partial [Firmicutes bacterium]|nr:hypothetical protein [Bacillota bacterium]
KYLGEVTYKSKLSDGTARMEFQVAENEDTEASVSGKYKIVAEDDGSINEGDMCIAEIKESSYKVKTICKISPQEAERILQSGMLASGDKVKTQTNSYLGFMDFLFGFMSFILAFMGAACIFNMVLAFIQGRPFTYIIVFPIAAAVFFSGANYAKKAKVRFTADNARNIVQKPTGYGLESLTLKLPRRLFVEIENFAVMSSRPSITIKNEMGVMLYYVHRELVSNNFYDIETPDGVSVGSIKFDPMDLETYRVELFGAQNFMVRRKMRGNSKSADYAVEGIDFYVQGSISRTYIYTLDSRIVAEISAAAAQGGGYHTERLAIETKPDYQMNMYMAAITACIVANNANRKRNKQIR